VNELMKSIMIGDSILSISPHNSEFCLNGRLCRIEYVSSNDSLCFHFRKATLWEKDNQTIADTTMLKYKVALVKAVAVTLEATGFKP
jgi:hypothetical protein